MADEPLSERDEDDPPADPREQALLTALEEVNRKLTIGMDVCAVLDCYFEAMMHLSFDNGVSQDDFEGLLDDMRADVAEWWRDRLRDPVIMGSA